MFDGSFRTNFEKLVSPIGGTLHRIGVSPDLVTGLGVAMAAGCAKCGACSALSLFEAGPEPGTP